MVEPTLPERRDRLHWAKVLKRLEEAGPKGILESDLAREFGVEPGGNTIEYVLKQLRDMDKIRTGIGTFEGRVGRTVQAVGKRRSTRDEQY